MKEAVHPRHAELVLNLDEQGISDWEDRKSKWVVIPILAEHQPVHHGVSWNLKHLSVVTCMSAGGQCLMPYMVTSQTSQPVCCYLSTTGLRNGIVNYRIDYKVSRIVYAEDFLSCLTRSNGTNQVPRTLISASIDLYKQRILPLFQRNVYKPVARFIGIILAPYFD